MKRKELIKIIKEMFTPFAQHYDFIFYKPDILLKIHDDTLHIIAFELPPESFYCRISIQPLYIPSDSNGVSLSFGNRINHFKARVPGVWGYSNDIDEVKNDFLEAKELLEKNAIPWFNETGSPEGIISFIESGASQDVNIMVGFPPHLRNLYLAFSYLYISKPELAIKSLQNVIDEYKNYNLEWVIKRREMLNNVMMLIKNEPDKIKEKLNEFIKQTKENLKLKE